MRTYVINCFAIAERVAVSAVCSRACVLATLAFKQVSNRLFEPGCSMLADCSPSMCKCVCAVYVTLKINKSQFPFESSLCASDKERHCCSEDSEMLTVAGTENVARI